MTSTKILLSAQIVAMSAALASLAQAQTAPAQPAAPAMPVPQDVKIETISVAPGIYMLMGRGGNIGLTVGTDGAAIIDSQFDDMAPKVRAAVAMLSGKPVQFLINTHLHGDHTGGNDAFGRNGAVIIAHENVRKFLGTAQVNPSNNAPIPARAREALPVVTFADTASLHFNDEDLQFTHLPNAHTNRHRGAFRQGECAAHGGHLHRRLSVHRWQHRWHARRPHPRA